jgi:hypothetical protein
MGAFIGAKCRGGAGTTSSTDMREGARPFSRGAVIEPIPKALLDSSVADIHAQWKLNEEIRNRPPGWKPPKKRGK